MSGATGAAAGGSGAEKGSSSKPATVTEDSARGSAVSDTGPRDEGSDQGGPVTDTRQPQPQPQEKAGSGAQQPYQPPQAYATEDGQSGGQAVRRPRTGATTAPRTRKARLRVARADPWSVMKVSFLLSIALGICTVVAVAVLWMVMNAMGVFTTVGATISEATGSSDGAGFDLQSFLSLPRVLLFTSIIAVIDVVLATALATLGAFIYNLSAGFVGGVELTLAEDE
ncbi:DUF3566 domain-containing protein [Streptomyces tubercidicus]|uniref:Membrane protein n=1 Tax=Streptomyces tubercidicus TaxID=47759 RepID=A0A640US91_9ACTN|nr:DUF3566 domain-containing protein [Streptomyces tubercidicus]WAU13088.1 DUF3566 domain-containing protein [Streptomyces tubercidicus]GFE38639.1 membrane protein [Streptomyces tubercidicus]